VREIKKLQNKNSIIFDRGNFDDWCVYIVNSSGQRQAPKDIEYFSRLKEIGNKHGNKKIYDDFVKIFESTTGTINSDTLDLIEKISTDYGAEQYEIEQWFTVLYAGMIAEENKNRSILKKRIKRLGMHQLLIDNKEPRIAANYSKKMPWRVLDGIMKTKGF